MSASSYLSASPNLGPKRKNKEFHKSTENPPKKRKQEEENKVVSLEPQHPESLGGGDNQLTGAELINVMQPKIIDQQGVKKTVFETITVKQVNTTAIASEEEKLENVIEDAITRTRKLFEEKINDLFSTENVFEQAAKAMLKSLQLENYNFDDSYTIDEHANHLFARVIPTFKNHVMDMLDKENKASIKDLQKNIPEEHIEKINADAKLLARLVINDRIFELKDAFKKLIKSRHTKSN